MLPRTALTPTFRRMFSRSLTSVCRHSSVEAATVDNYPPGRLNSSPGHVLAKSPSPGQMARSYSSPARVRSELVAKQTNNDNPFDHYTLKPDAGVGLYKNSPILIPSANSSRVVGCCCEDDYQEIVWFELHKGEVQKCDCGNYFQLIDYDPLDPNIKPKFGEGFGSGLGSMYY